MSDKVFLVTGAATGIGRASGGPRHAAPAGAYAPPTEGRPGRGCTTAPVTNRQDGTHGSGDTANRPDRPRSAVG